MIAAGKKVPQPEPKFVDTTPEQILSGLSIEPKRPGIMDNYGFRRHHVDEFYESACAVMLAIMKSVSRYEGEKVVGYRHRAFLDERQPSNERRRAALQQLMKVKSWMLFMDAHEAAEAQRAADEAAAAERAAQELLLRQAQPTQADVDALAAIIAKATEAETVLMHLTEVIQDHVAGRKARRDLAALFSTMEAARGQMPDRKLATPPVRPVVASEPDALRERLYAAFFAIQRARDSV